MTTAPGKMCVPLISQVLNSSPEITTRPSVGALSGMGACAAVPGNNCYRSGQVV